MFGCYARFVSLGMWPLAEDEYYLTTAALKTLAFGVPQLECGGYYVRGILLQYLSIFPLKIFESIEFAARILPSITSLLAVIPVYLIAKKFGGIYVALIAIILFMLSVWEIEFARFARMYSPFQLVFLIYILYLIKSVYEPSSKSQYVLFGMSFLSIFLYEGAIFLLALNFLPFILGFIRINKTNILLLISLPIVYMKYTLTDFRAVNSGNVSLNDESVVTGMPSNFIDDATVSTTASSLKEISPQIFSSFPIQVSDSMWGMIYVNQFYLIPIVLLVFAGLYFFVRFVKSSRVNFLLYALLLSILLASLLHMLFLWLCLLILILLFYSKLSDEKSSPIISILTNNNLLLFLVSTLLILFVHLIFYFSNYDGISEMPKYFLKYPDFYYKVARLWFQAMPIQSIVMASVIIVTSLFCLIRYKELDKRICFLAGIVLVLFLAVSILQTTYSQIKYTFFIYPLVLILFSIAVVYLLEVFKKNKVLYMLVLPTLIFGSLYIFEDYNFKHIINVQAAEINFRQNYSMPKYMQYYPRKDYRTPGEYINNNLKSGDVVVSIYVPVVAHYLDQLDYMFWYKNEEEFVGLSACDGKKEFWTNANLISDKQQLYELLENDKNIWLINFSANRRSNDLEIEKYIRAKYKDNIVYSNIDKTIDVYKINSN